MSAAQSSAPGMCSARHGPLFRSCPEFCAFWKRIRAWELALSWSLCSTLSSPPQPARATPRRTSNSRVRMPEVSRATTGSARRYWLADRDPAPSDRCLALAVAHLHPEQVAPGRDRPLAEQRDPGRPVTDVGGTARVGPPAAGQPGAGAVRALRRGEGDRALDLL